MTLSRIMSILMKREAFNMFKSHNEVQMMQSKVTEFDWDKIMKSLIA